MNCQYGTKQIQGYDGMRTVCKTAGESALEKIQSFDSQIDDIVYAQEAFQTDLAEAQEDLTGEIFELAEASGAEINAVNENIGLLSMGVNTAMNQAPVIVAGQGAMPKDNTEKLIKYGAIFLIAVILIKKGVKA